MYHLFQASWLSLFSVQVLCSSGFLCVPSFYIVQKCSIYFHCSCTAEIKAVHVALIFSFLLLYEGAK